MAATYDKVRVDFLAGETPKEVSVKSMDTVRRCVIASLAENTVGGTHLMCVYARYRGDEISIFVQLAVPAVTNGYVEVHYVESEE